MNFFQSSPGFEPIHLINGFDFESIRNGIFVDIGGSHGAVSIEVAKRYSTLHCIVQDLPLATKDGTAHVPEELCDRVQFMEHDFFQPQPVKHADIYYFRWIFHGRYIFSPVHFREQACVTLPIGNKKNH